MVPPTAVRVEGLSVEFGGRMSRKPIRVVHDVSFSVEQGQTLAIVGESGSGKSTIGKAILGLAPCAEGTVMLGNRDITHVPLKARRTFATELQVIFQDPYGSLNPSLTIGDVLTEPLRASGTHTAAQARTLIGDLLHRVGLPADAADRYPGHFSGGQRQRIAIARAISVRPKVIVCDEPTSALDVSTQAQVLDLLTELQQELGAAYLFITHDLALVRSFADTVMVVKAGRIVERGEAKAVCDYPQDLYTQALIAAAPVPDPVLQRQRREARKAKVGELRAREAAHR